jgi:hypothetical protein
MAVGVAVLACMLGAPLAEAGDAVTKCGAKKLKSYNGIFKALYTEAAAACAAGSAGNPQPVDAPKITAAVDAANAAFAAADLEFGAQNCVQFSVAAATVIVSAQTLANNFCLAP